MQYLPATSVSTSIVSSLSFLSFMNTAPSARITRKYRWRRAVFLRLLLLGICLEGLYLALFPFLGGNNPVHDPLFQAWHTFLPWLPQLHWTRRLPARLWSYLAWFDPGTPAGNANWLLVVLSLILLGVLLAVQVGRLQRHRSLLGRSAYARLILVFAILFALTILVSPPHLNIFSRDMVLFWLAGRMIATYHLNPYIVAPIAYPPDIATTLLTHFSSDPTNLSYSSFSTSGPVGIDISILVSLLGQGQVANTLLSFRMLGLLLHLGNALFIWLILRKDKPELSIPALVLYAWNPLFLLLGVAQTHLELVSLFFVLLTIYFLQRDAHVLSWFFLLLAALINLVCLLLFPLFLCMILRKTRSLVPAEQFLVRLALLLLSPLVFVLAYLPYWNGWGWHGLVTSMSLVFFPTHPLNSLDGMLLAFPFPPTILNLFNPVHWCDVLLSFMGIFLLFSFWLADTVDWLLLCASWLLLIFLILQPLYWPWYMLLPLALVLCSSRGKTLLLAILLLVGSLFSYYCWLREVAWPGQALLVLGFPCIVWGWYMFFIATWELTLGKEEELAATHQQVSQHPRPPWCSPFRR